MVKVRFVFVLILGLVAASTTFHTLASQQMAEAFTQEMLAKLLAQISICPESMPDPGPYRVVACARLQLKDKEFKRKWDRMTRKYGDKPHLALEVEDWKRNEQGFEKIYEVDGTPFKVFWNAQSGYLILSYITDVEMCLDSLLRDDVYSSEGNEEIMIPRIIPESKVQANYPLKALRARKGGSVFLRAIINEDGTVSDICMLKVENSGYGFEQAALNAVRKWKYEPATLHGKPVKVLFTVVMNFDVKATYR